MSDEETRGNDHYRKNQMKKKETLPKRLDKEIAQLEEPLGQMTTKTQTLTLTHQPTITDYKITTKP